jgi:hypothetical protein
MVQHIVNTVVCWASEAATVLLELWLKMNFPKVAVCNLVEYTVRAFAAHKK